jgi:ubiquinone/menaquinone biosynthesis C-methylase UbiE
MYPLFSIWFKGENINEVMDFKSRAITMSDEELIEIYNSIQTRSKDRPTDMNKNCIKLINEKIDPKARSLLDVGCGSGYFLKQLTHPDLSLHGCDILITPAILHAKYTCASVEGLPFSDDQFDVVTCNHTLEHVRNLSQAILELKRVARKQVIITVPRQRCFYYTLDLHLHFFFKKEMLINIIQMENFDCRLVMGDWVYVGYLQDDE